MEPAVIVADEPMSGPDVSIRGQMLNLLEDVQVRTSDLVLTTPSHEYTQELLAAVPTL